MRKKGGNEKNKCGGSDCEEYIREVIVGWYYSFIIHEKLYVNEKKEKMWKEKEKIIQMKKKRMRMKCENEMKRKEGRKGVMWWEKERIGGWSRSEKFALH